MRCALVNFNVAPATWANPINPWPGITNDISTVAMFFTLNGKLLGRPTQGLFHMRQADVRAVQELSVRSAGFYDGTAATMLRGSRMQLLCGETGMPGVVTFVLNARISQHARSHDAGARRRIRNRVCGRTVCHEV